MDDVSCICTYIKKEENLLCPITKPLNPKKNPKRNVTTEKKRHQNFDETTIANRLKTVSWSNNSHQTGVVKPIYGYPTFLLTTTVVLSKGHTFKIKICK